MWQNGCFLSCSDESSCEKVRDVFASRPVILFGISARRVSRDKSRVIKMAIARFQPVRFVNIRKQRKDIPEKDAMLDQTSIRNAKERSVARVIQHEKNQKRFKF
jgi:hypothetical protein